LAQGRSAWPFPTATAGSEFPPRALWRCPFDAVAQQKVAACQASARARTMSGHGYGESKRRAASRSRSAGFEKRHKGDKRKKEKKQQRDQRDAEDPRARKRPARSRSRRGGERGSAPEPPPAREPPAKQAQPQQGAKQEEAVLGRTKSESVPVAVAPRAAWRDELDKGKAVEEDDPPLDGIVMEPDDDEVERKLAESRARREALIAKWVNKGEGANGQGSLETPDTGMDAEASDDSDGEASPTGPAEKREKPDEQTLEQMKEIQRFVLQQKAEHDDENEMFDENIDESALKQGNALKQSAAISTTGASADDWDDKEGYYKAKIGEVMGGRYLVTEDKCGQGVFSNVVKCTDQQDNIQVAIKIMRCNDMMRKAAEKEIDILERLAKADRAKKSNVIRLIRTFSYRGHLCLVFECMWDNLRVALKKYTKDKGMSLQAVKAYTKQLLIALRHIHRSDIIHADIKPDNILISAGHNIVKICDLGSAMDLTEVEPTPYLVSRFYRAPELCLCKEYGPPIDVWALGCALFELFTGKILFQGKSNNDMIRLYMEVKGKLPHKMIKSGSLWKQHFNEDLDFRFQDVDKVTRKKKIRTITDWTKPRKIEDMVMQRIGTEKQKSSDPEDILYIKKAKQFADLMDKMTTCDPEKRVSADEALSHPFVTEPGPGAPAKGGSQGDKGPKSKEGAPAQGKPKDAKGSGRR